MIAGTEHLIMDMHNFYLVGVNVLKHFAFPFVVNCDILSVTSSKRGVTGSQITGVAFFLLRL